MLAAGFGIFEQGGKASGHGRGVHRPGGRSVAALLQRRRPGARHQERLLARPHLRPGHQGRLPGRRTPSPAPTPAASRTCSTSRSPQLYYVAPINSTWKWGIGVDTPFGLTTDWKNPDSFAGRFLSTKAAIRAFDVNPSLGWQADPRPRASASAPSSASRTSTSGATPAAINPFTQRAANVAQVDLKADLKTGYGWNVGIARPVQQQLLLGPLLPQQGEDRLHRRRPALPGLDRQPAVRRRGRRPDCRSARKLPVKTTIDFPDMASLGLAFGLTPNLLLETDVNWTGWKSFDKVDINFTSGDLPNSIRSRPTGRTPTTTAPACAGRPARRRSGASATSTTRRRSPSRRSTRCSPTPTATASPSATAATGRPQVRPRSPLPRTSRSARGARRPSPATATSSAPTRPRPCCSGASYTW